MQYLNIAGYQFVSLKDLPALRQDFLSQCQSLQLKGTILLSHEGININLAGEPANVEQFILQINKCDIFSPINFRFHRSYSDQLPFQRLKVKLKKEIITLRQSSGNPTPEVQAPRISPQQLKEWLDNNRQIQLIDTRNDYELSYGTFNQAVHLSLQHFCELPNKISNISKSDSPQEMILFCTGGIRCEKAALYLRAQGFTNVYQLDGGILGYFAEVGSAHYQGECYVFDERVSVHPDQFVK
jgi:UPF0176 protein